MGGRTSEVSAATSNVLLESAYFTRGGVLLTARRLDLHTEASHRFERGTDPEGVDRAAARCAQLIAGWAGGRVLSGAAGFGEAPSRRWVSVRPSRASALLGYPVSADAAVEVFDTLGMTNRTDGDRIEVEVPGYRTDVDREVDLIEEIVRMRGYEHVGSTLPRAPHAGGLPEGYAFARKAKDVLVRAGLREIRPVPFVSVEDLAMFGDTDAVEVANPLRAEEGFLRTRLTPGLLRTVARNQALGVDRAAIFEVGTTFRLADPFREYRKAGFALCGPAGEGWAGERRNLDVLDAKGVLQALLHDLGVHAWTLGGVPAGPFHPGRSAEVLVAGAHVGVLGEIHPRVAEDLGIAGRVAVGVIGLRAVGEADGRPFVFADVPRFPPLRRDLAFVIGEDARAGDVQTALEEAAGDLLGGCILFDVFLGGSLPRGYKSLAFAVDFRAPDRTLTDEEAQAAVEAIVDRLRADFGAELRAG